MLATLGWVKRVALLKELREIARSKGLMLELQRRGAKHDVWRLGRTTLIVPRHRAISRFTAEGLIKDAEGAQPW